MTVDRLIAQADVAAKGSMPAGTYGATLTDAKVVKRKKDQAWMLRLIAHVDLNNRDVIEWRPLARRGDDPYNLSDGQRRSWREFARRLELDADSVQAQVDELGQRLGQSITVEIKDTMLGYSVRMNADQGIHFANTNGALTTSGEIVTAEARTDLAHNSHRMLLEGLRAARLGLSAAAEACYQLSREQAWVDLGYKTLNEYLASPEISISRSEFFRMTAIWEQYILEGGIAPLELQAGEPSKLEVPLRALAANEVTAQEALEDVRTLGRADLREKYGQATEKKDPEPKDEQTQICTHCGHGPEPSGKALVYHGRVWPAWMTDDMARAAVAATRKDAA